MLEAMEALHRAGLKSISTVAKAKEKTLAKLIKPVGFFNMKAQIRLIIVKRRRWRLFRLVT